MSTARKLLFSLVILGLFFGGVEAGLRAMWSTARTATLPEGVIRAHLNAAGFVHDPDLYWYWGALPSPAMQINEHGFRRTAPMQADKPDGVTRVVVLGDSQTLGAGVGPDEAYAAQAEAALGEGWEVLNAGISGYRSLNVYRLLQRRIERFDPDVVVIDCMPFDSVTDDGPLVVEPLRGPWDWLAPVLYASRTWRLLQLSIDKLRPSRRRWLDQAPEPVSTAGKGPFAQGQREGQGNHHLIAQWGLDHGVQVVFMQYPVSTDQFHHDCMTLPGELPEGLPVVPACDALRASGVSARSAFLDRNHMTPAGNRIVGQALAETLLSLER